MFIAFVLARIEMKTLSITLPDPFLMRNRLRSLRGLQQHRDTISGGGDTGVTLTAARHHAHR